MARQGRKAVCILMRVGADAAAAEDGENEAAGRQKGSARRAPRAPKPSTRLNVGKAPLTLLQYVLSPRFFSSRESDENKVPASLLRLLTQDALLGAA